VIEISDSNRPTLHIGYSCLGEHLNKFWFLYDILVLVLGDNTQWGADRRMDG